MAEEEFKERIANFIKCNYGALNVLVNDDGTFEEIQKAELTELDHDQPEQRSSDEEDRTGKKKRIPFPCTGINAKIIYDIYNPVICSLYKFNMYQFF